MEDFIKFREDEKIKEILESIDINEILTEEEATKMVEDFKIQLKELGLTDEQIESMDEGLLGGVLGGVAGFVVGPTIGKVIAKALGIEKGILFDMFKSRLVGAALGAAIAGAFKKRR